MGSGTGLDSGDLGTLEAQSGHQAALVEEKA